MKKNLLFLLLVFTNLAVVAQGGTTCAGAVNLTTNGTYQIGALTSGTYPTGTGLCFTSAAAAPNARWFKFTPTQSGTLTVTSNIAANDLSATDTRLSILTGTCGTTWTCISANDDVDATNYSSEILNLTVTSGTTYYIVWDDRWETVTRSFDFIFTPQTCFKPTNYTFLAQPTTTTASIGWTAPASGTPTGYEFEYGLRGFTQGTGTVLTPTATSVSLSTLSPSSVYSFYVRTNCGSGDYSIWDGPINFNTVFEPVNPTYTTSFEDSELDFIGWLSATPVSGGQWSIYGSTAGDPLVQDGASSVFSLSSTSTPTNSMLISRGVNLVAGQPASISFYALNYRASGNTTSNASYELNYGSDQTTASQTNLIATEPNLSSTTYVLTSYSFTPSSTGVYYFSLKNTSPINGGGATHGLIIDNFTVTQTLSAADFNAAKFSVYPNPVNDIVNISNDGTIQINKVSIVDVNGRTVKSMNFNEVTDAQINVADLNSGVYFMTINSNEGSVTKKIVKN